MKNMGEAVQDAITTATVRASFLNPFTMRNWPTAPEKGQSKMNHKPRESILGSLMERLMILSFREMSPTWCAGHTRSSSLWKMEGRHRNCPIYKFLHSYSSYDSAQHLQENKKNQPNKVLILVFKWDKDPTHLFGSLLLLMFSLPCFTFRLTLIILFILVN